MYIVGRLRDQSLFKLSPEGGGGGGVWAKQGEI